MSNLSAPITQTPKDEQQIELPTPVMEAPREVGLSDIYSDVRSGDWSAAAKDLFYLVFGTARAVEGLGFEYERLGEIPEAQRAELCTRIKDISQKDLPWINKLELAALNSALELPDISPGRDKNDLIVDYLKNRSQVGDIIFVSSEGKAEPFLAEVFQNTFREFSGDSPIDRRFPFSHVLINIGEGRLLHLTFKGVREHTWEKVFQNSELYDAVAIARLDASKEARERFAQAAEEFSRGKTYNYMWGILEGPAELLLRQRHYHITDESVTPDTSVCFDLATEAARTVREEGFELGPDVQQSICPLDLFKCSSLKIIEAAELKRDDYRSLPFSASASDTLKKSA